MKIPTLNRSLAGRRLGLIAFALALASVVSVTAVRPAVADQRDGDDRGRREHEEQRHGHRHEHHPIYAPAPIYYPRHESPGISLFLPFDVR
jgi:hypothetical protein